MTAGAPLVVVGDALLDQDIDGVCARLAPDAPVPVLDVARDRYRPGGAALAAVLAARAGRPVLLVTALGGDPASTAVRRLLTPRVKVVEMPLHGTLPVKTRIMADGHPLVRVDRGNGSPGRPGRAVTEVLRQAHTVLVADYGRGTAAAVREQLAALCRRATVVWDPHPRGQTPVPGVRLVTPNAAEVRAFTGDSAADASLRSCAEGGSELAGRWRAAAVAVTLAERGVLLARPGATSPMLVPAPYRATGDACGAGDCFAAETAGALADGCLPEEAVQRGVAEAAAFVAAGGAGNPALWSTGQAPFTGRAGAETDPFALAERVRARGGTVVATGGCFDLLHAGHVGLLESARRIGDCLIVCVNSDASITRLKGPGRPLSPLADRVRVLAGLGCVDAVAVFDEDTPTAVLGRLKPHVWAKGGDYDADALPEAAAVRSWDGQCVVLPYLDGRSTTQLARRAAASVRRHVP
ncbi:PfkB family carbohydrate kinase [Actinacidiphila glaucinigra]|uniref:PfkB family carbohydrate kinase n=1 Tax=Actinacidiphila glaucinigra TaxID=235986 RepID=UPI0033F62CCA